MSNTVTVDDLVRDRLRFLGRRLRLVRMDEYKSDVSPGGVVPAQPQLRRQTAQDSLPTYGEQALQEDDTYTYGGADDRTLVFISEATDMPMQIFRSELPGASFWLLP